MPFPATQSIVMLRALMLTARLVYHVKQGGWQFIGNYDIAELYYQYNAKMIETD